MKTIDEVYKDAYYLESVENDNAITIQQVAKRTMLIYAKEIIDECAKLSILKWSAGESGILTKEDTEILKANLK